MKIKNIAFFGVMAAILSVGSAARADSTTVIASQAYVDAKDALDEKTTNKETATYAASTNKESTTVYPSMYTLKNAYDTLNTAIGNVDVSAAVYDGIRDGVTTTAPSENAVYDEIHVASNGNYIRSANTVAANLGALDTATKNAADAASDAQATADAKVDIEQDPETGANKIFTTDADGKQNLTAPGDHLAISEGQLNVTGVVASNNAITGATKTKITYDSKGLVTAGDDLAESDIPDLHLAKVTDVTATAAEVNVLDGIPSTLTATELGYVDGVTSAIQTQLDNKQANLGGTVNNESTNGKVVTATGTAGSVTYTAIDTEVTANSDNLITSGAVSTAIGNASSAVNSAYADNALDASGLAASSELAKMEAIQDTVARQGTFGKAWSDEFNSTDIGDSGATNLYAASKNSNEGSDMDNYVPTVKAVEKRLNGATTSDLAKLHNVSADASELNILDGATVTTAELNILDGVTATTTEINKLAGLTADTTELNYVDGVTSNIQTQLDAKQGTLTFDATPTSDSTNPVTSGGVYTALAGKQASFNDGTQSGSGLVKTVTQSGGTVSATASLGVYVSDMNNALKDVSSNSTASCTKGSPCTLTYYKDGTNEYMRWTPMDTESTDADTTAADRSNA